jgi:23S rRNA (pseudouridine1915-N3)-methyltransferase
MNIEIWSVGKENDPHIEVGILNYFKKIKPYASIQLEIIQIPKSKLSQDAEKNKNLEAEYILKKLQTHHYLILLDETGKKLNSPQWAQQLQQLMNQRVKTLVFLICGA